MIRCNNCGWFNPDSASHCEKCDESLAGLPVETPSENTAEEESEPIPVPVKNEEKPVSKMLQETVRMKGAEPEQHQVRDLTATVMDTSAILKADEPVQCPKCRYPVYGYADTCPNCGSSLRRPNAAQAPSSAPDETLKVTTADAASNAPAPAEGINLKGTVMDASAHPGPVPKAPVVNAAKATIRELPSEFIAKTKSEMVDAWRLIPVESPDSETIVMLPGDIICIGNRRYKFQK